MTQEPKISRKTYLTANIGEFPSEIQIGPYSYQKVFDLRYGTNPHQPAAFYRPIQADKLPIGHLEILKMGKSGLSQTNLEDISYALNIVKFFDEPACACMKHVNPSGVAIGKDLHESAASVYRRARLSDPRAAFGCTAGFNCCVDQAAAEAIMEEFTECVVAPEYTPEALAVFEDQERFKLNKHIRIIRCGDLKKIPKFVGDVEDITLFRTLKVLHDGSLVIADPLLTNLRGITDLRPAQVEDKKKGIVQATVPATDAQKRDLLSAWYININVRSNGVVIFKNGETLAIGTGEQDRVGAVEQAIEKAKTKYKGQESLENAVMASDGFFPFPDAVEVAAFAGIRAILAPAGSIHDADVIQRANELNVALFHAPERIFSHH